jgi:RHS repeat-associated protein
MEAMEMARRTIGVLCLVLVGLVPRVARAQTEQVYYYHTDAIESVRMITNESGQEITRYDFWPFGQVVGSPIVQDSRMFAGKEHDGESALDYFGGRYYASQTGRFTSVDPALDSEKARVDPQQWNRYSYAFNNPHRYVDPDGRQAGAEFALDVDQRLLITGKITKQEYIARLRARADGALVGAGLAAGVVGWRVLLSAAASCFLSPSCQSTVLDALEGLAGGPPRITPTGDMDPAARALAERFSGEASVAIEGFGSREFDMVSREYVGQTTSAVSALLKPANFLSKANRDKIRATLEAAKALGKKAYFEFRSGADDEVIDFIRRNADRIGVEFDVSR